MIVDTSAILAIILGEPGAAELFEALADAPVARMSVAGLVECHVVVGRRFGPAQRQRLLRLLDDLGVEITPVTVRQADLAVSAHERYGVGGGSPAKLNFGDCLSYALAAETGEPLLFVGNDFTYTDLTLAAIPGG